MGQLKKLLQDKLRDAVSCKNRGNALVSPIRGKATDDDWNAAAMAYLQGLHVLDEFASNVVIILGFVLVQV